MTADLVSHELALARIAIDSGRPDTALPLLASGRGKAQALAANDPQNVRRKAQVRMFDLMRLKALLAMPAARSRDDPTLAALNGDCEADLSRLKNDELSDFCRILAARRGATAIAAVGPALAARGDLLTDQWGLDLAQERRLGGIMKESAR